MNTGRKTELEERQAYSEQRQQLFKTKIKTLVQGTKNNNGSRPIIWCDFGRLICSAIL